MRRIMPNGIAGQQPLPFLRAIGRIMDPAQLSKTDVINRLLPGPGAWVCLMVIFGAICWLVFRVRAYWRDDAEGDASPHEMLAQFRESHREGVLTAEEYRLIKSRLVRGITPGTVTERHESADRSSDSVKGVAAPRTAAASDGENCTEIDRPR